MWEVSTYFVRSGSSFGWGKIDHHQIMEISKVTYTNYWQVKHVPCLSMWLLTMLIRIINTYVEENHLLGGVYAKISTDARGIKIYTEVRGGSS